MKAGMGLDRLRVLVVDDDAALRLTLVNALRLRFVVVEASRVDEARELLKGAPIDVLLSDYDLGANDTGLTLLREVRLRYPATRRILMTGGVPEDVVIEDELVEFVIKKPFDVPRLIRRILRR